MPLWQHVMVGDRLYDLFVDDRTSASDGQPGAGAAGPRRSTATQPGRPRDSAAAAPRRRGGRAGRRTRVTPSRVEVVERLDAERPAAGDHLHLQPGRLRRGGPAVPARRACGSPRPRSGREIREHRRARTARPPRRGPRRPRVRRVARRPRARDRRPPRRACCRRSRRSSRSCSSAGLVRCVFATETLALGINMPARSVVLEKLVEVERRDARRRHAGGVHPADRARRPARHRRRGARGRRSGTRASTRARVAGLASTRTYPLRSSFRPSYNMAVNLVGRSAATARELLETSFAQFQADRAVVGLARQVRTQRGGARRATARR